MQVWRCALGYTSTSVMCFMHCSLTDWRTASPAHAQRNKHTDRHLQCTRRLYGGNYSHSVSEIHIGRANVRISNMECRWNAQCIDDEINRATGFIVSKVNQRVSFSEQLCEGSKSRTKDVGRGQVTKMTSGPTRTSLYQRCLACRLLCSSLVGRNTRLVRLSVYLSRTGF